MSHQPLSSLLRLDGRSAVVTGAGRGIGAAVAARLAEAGANVVGVDIDHSAESRGAGIVPLVVDVCDFDAPEEIYDMLALIGAPGRYAVKAVRHRPSGEIAAVSSTDKLYAIAGKYVGKDDPVLIVRSQGSFPAVGEVLEPFAFAQAVQGWMRGSHFGPLMPCSIAQSNPSRFDGPPRVVCAGFQLSGGMLVGPVDMFDDPSFDESRRQANIAADYFRRHGPFEPHRLPLEEMEYTTMPKVTKKLRGRCVPID